MTNYTLDNNKIQERVNATISSKLDAIESGDLVLCNKDKKLYSSEDTFVCFHDKEDYHTDYRKFSDEGAMIMEDSLEEYNELQDINNWPEYG